VYKSSDQNTRHQHQHRYENIKKGFKFKFVEKEKQLRETSRENNKVLDSKRIHTHRLRTVNDLRMQQPIDDLRSFRQ